MLNGDAVKACTVLAVQADSGEVTTIEGLAPEGSLHPIQEGFWEKHGLQCGFCTPGMILASYQLLKNYPIQQVGASSSRESVTLLKVP